MKAIIIAAGSAQRLGKKTKDLPKSLLSVNKKTILVHQVDELKKCKINEIVIILGPNKDQFPSNGFTFVNDSNFDEHDILGSLMEAQDHLTNEVLVIYSDILFENSILEDIINTQCDIGIAIDLDWEKNYIGRTEHPKNEAENVLLQGNKIMKIRKNIESSQNNQTVGEFLGIIKLSTKGCEIFKTHYNIIEKNHFGRFHNAHSLKKAYLTDMIQELIESKIEVKPIFISGKWCEIDTNQDLERAIELFD